MKRFETVNVNLTKKPDWFMALNSAGLVPVLQHGLGDERFIPESLIISEYLDDLFPENRLKPTDPYVNACHKLLIDKFSKVTGGFYKLLKGNGEKRAMAKVEIPKSLKPYEAALKNSDFIGGDKPRLIDYMLWPWFEVNLIFFFLNYFIKKF